MQGGSSSSSSAANVARLSTRRGGGSNVHQMAPVENSDDEPEVLPESALQSPARSAQSPKAHTPALTVSDESEDGGAGGE